MIKAFGIILIVLSSTLIGFYYGEKFKRRVRQLKDMQQGVYVLKNEINFTRTLLPEAFYKAGQKCSFPVSNLFLNISQLLEKGGMEIYECVQEAVKINKGNLEFKEGDISILYDLGKCLGEMDVEGHNDILGLALVNIDKAVKDAELNLDKNVKMYRYLGFSFGAMIGIVLL